MSVRDVAFVMDPVRWPAMNAEPISVLELARCHRWVGDDPPKSVSWKSICDRHTNPLTTRHRFLSYNTFLLQPTCNLPALVDALFSIRDLLEVSNRVAEDLFNPLNITKDFILDTFGISEGEFLALKIAALGPFAAIPAAATEVLKIIGHSPLEIIERRFTASQVLAALGIDLSFNVQGKPALDARAGELADQLLDYDVVALCELWHQTHQAILFDELGGSPLQKPPLTSHPRQITACLGPQLAGEPPHETAIGSGLCVIALDRQIVLPEQPPPLVFERKGVSRQVAPPAFPFDKDLGRFVDADLWAKKGVLLTHLDAAPGMTVEIFSTHLYSGGDLSGGPIEDVLSFFGLPLVKVDVNGKEAFDIRLAQVDEFIEFFKNSGAHNAANVAILVGDFNINAHDQRTFQDPRLTANGAPLEHTAYEGLTKRLNEIGFEDAWTRFGRNTKNGKPSQGFTHDGDDVLKGINHELICAARPSDRRFCDDDAVSSDPGGKRYDYIFVQQPSTSHTYNLDFSRIRRRPFERHPPTDGMRFLSDHLGLDVTLIVSPHA